MTPGEPRLQRRARRGPAAAAFGRWFTQAPRPHGALDEERTVGFLELFYDLVFVVLVAQLGGALAASITWHGVRDYAITFGLVWLGWINGSLYHELHGREDGRSRIYIFGQMFVLVALAAWAPDAAGAGGQAFALAYALLLAVLTVQWWGVRRIDPDEYRAITGRYLAAMLASIAAIVVSAFVGSDARLGIWAAVAGLWVAGALARFGLTPTEDVAGIRVTRSFAERCSAFVIIVLGEVVAGVVAGMHDGGRTSSTITAGLVALLVAFGCWWNYFDLVGLRLPRRSHGHAAAWMALHLPVTASIAMCGVGVVALIEHAGAARTPPATAWLLGGATAVVLVSIVALTFTIEYGHEAALVGRVSAVLLLGAALAVVVAALHPAPWLLAGLLAVDLTLVWTVAFALRATLVARGTVAHVGDPD